MKAKIYLWDKKEKHYKETKANYEFDSVDSSFYNLEPCMKIYIEQVDEIDARPTKEAQK